MIATVLLIVLVLVLAVIIFLWARGFISEHVEKFGNPIENSCEDASFDVQFVGGMYDQLEIVNRGNLAIHGFEIKAFTGGDSEILPLDSSGVGVGGSVTKTVALDSDVEKIIVYPVLLGNVKGKSTNKVFTCLDFGKSIEL